MKTIAVVGQKGGSGKSTVALHIAACATQAGLRTAIIDTDPQGTAHKWYERREAENPEVQREVDADELPRLANLALLNGVKLLIVDTPGKAETMALAACEVADLVLVPIRPTQPDLETLGTVKRTVRLAERLQQTYVMLSQCPTTSQRVFEFGDGAVRSYDLMLVPHAFYSRADFAHAMTDGLTATEFAPTGKAAQEANALFDWIRNKLNLKTKGAE